MNRVAPHTETPLSPRQDTVSTMAKEAVFAAGVAEQTLLSSPAKSAASSGPAQLTALPRAPRIVMDTALAMMPPRAPTRAPLIAPGTAPPPPPDPKRQICFDFTKNQCARGAACKFSHSVDLIISVNSQEKGICFDYLKGTCARGPLCRFSHDLTNLQIVGQQQEQAAQQQQAITPPATPGATAAAPAAHRPSAPICYDFVKSQCSRGAECKYSHDFASILTGTRAPAQGKNPFVMCMDFARGRCARGASCRYVHGTPGSEATTPTAAAAALGIFAGQQQQQFVFGAATPTGGMTPPDYFQGLPPPPSQSPVGALDVLEAGALALGLGGADYAAALLQLQHIQLADGAAAAAAVAAVGYQQQQQQHQQNAAATAAAYLQQQQALGSPPNQTQQHSASALHASALSALITMQQQQALRQPSSPSMSFPGMLPASDPAAAFQFNPHVAAGASRSPFEASADMGLPPPLPPPVAISVPSALEHAASARRATSQEWAVPFRHPMLAKVKSSEAIGVGGARGSGAGSGRHSSDSPTIRASWGGQNSRQLSSEHSSRSGSVAVSPPSEAVAGFDAETSYQSGFEAVKSIWS